MLRKILVSAAAVVLTLATIAPDEAFAFRGGGGRGGGGAHRGGGMHAGGAGHGRHYAGRPGHPIAGRPGRPIAGRPGYPGRPVAGYPGRGYGWGAAAAGAAALGAYGYYNNNQCYYDQNGQWVCPYQQRY